MKVIIAGGRDFNDLDLLIEEADKVLRRLKSVEIVSGKQRTHNEDKSKRDYGADYLGELYAQKRGFKVTGFPADWKSLGKSAGMVRNKQMAEYADALIAFWDGNSVGTKNMIDLARSYDLQVKIIRY